MTITREWIRDHTDMHLGTVQVQAVELLELLKERDIGVRVMTALQTFITEQRAATQKFHDDIARV